MTLKQQLQDALLQTLSTLAPSELLERVVITHAKDLQYGDYQTNAAMILAKALRTPPKKLANKIVETLKIDHLAITTITGPGFISFRITPECFASHTLELARDSHCGLIPTNAPKRYLIDFSSPNVAKPMHVGHIRSTIIGDALTRIARQLGHEVITDNHLGDWGTQFGMVIWAWKRVLDEGALELAPLQELLRLYRHATEATREDETIKEECRQELVQLQRGDPENHAIWEKAVALSKQGLQHIYDRLEVSFDHWIGESFYNDSLKPTVSALVDAGVARMDNGATCAFSGGDLPPKKDPFQKRHPDTKDWIAHPMIIRKSDGAYNYATTDLATLAYRRDTWSPDHILYVVDHRQSEHFQQLFDIARRQSYLSTLHHVAFGTICGTDGKPLKTRAGDLPQLDDVLDEAVLTAQKVITEKSHLELESERKTLAETIGIASVKFTELSHNRMSDYNFDLNKMVALEGDTAPYLMYSYVRPTSIFRKLEHKFQLPSSLTLTEEQEIHLSRMLARFAEVLPTVLEEYKPNILTSYLLELARSFHSFFESCPVLKATGTTQSTRLTLCLATANTLKLGLSLLGITAPDKM